MNALIKTVLTCLILSLATAVIADEAKKPRPKTPAHSPEWTDLNSSDPGVASTVDELQRIVVLCATDYNSAEFKRAWASYVRKNKLTGAQLDRTIQRVVNEAFEHRQEFGQTKGKRASAAAWKTSAQKAMHDTSKAMIQNVRG